MPHSHRRLASALVSASLLLSTGAGCKAAKIYKRDGTITEGRILSSDADSVAVSTDAAGIQNVSRDQIVAVKHPGRGLTIVGGFVSAIYASWVVSGWVELRREQPDYMSAQYFINSGTAGTLVGLGLIGWGLFNYERSRALFEAPAPPATATSADTTTSTQAPQTSRRPALVPTMVRDAQGAPRPAAGVLLRF